MGWSEQYKKAITFSYDDGVEQDLRLLDILNAHGLKATFNVNTGLHRGNGSWKYENRIWIHRMDLEQVADRYQGHEIAMHTLTHPNLCELDVAASKHEILGDMDAIEKIWGKRPVGGAYPYGCYNDQVISLLQQNGIQYCRGVWENHQFDLQSNLLAFRPTCHHDDEMLFDLAKNFLQVEPEKEGTQIFYVWGHSYEFDCKANWDRIERLCDLVAGRDDIFYGTNAEVLLDD